MLNPLTHQNIQVTRGEVRFDFPEFYGGPQRRSVSRLEERGFCWRRQVSDNGCIYGTTVVGRRGWQRRGESLFLGSSCQQSGEDTVIKNCKPSQSKGALYSIGGKGGVKK